MNYICPCKHLGKVFFMFRFQSYLPPSDDIKLASRSEIPVRHGIPVDDVSGSTGAREYMSRFPARFTAFMYAKNGLVLKISLMVLVFISAIYTREYSGEFQRVINNNIGGVFYVVFGSLAFSILFPRLNLFLPVLMATSATCFLEFVQWFRFPFMLELTKNKIFAYLFGNSFNPADFIYYGIGTVTALLVLWMVRNT
jgi:hypothetical protein